MQWISFFENFTITHTKYYNYSTSMNVFNAFRRYLTSEIPPNKVCEISTDQLAQRRVLCREDGMILYLPAEGKSDKPYYEIVLHRPIAETSTKAFSLFRTSERDMAEIKFVDLKDKLPIFIEVSKDMCNVNGLQKICDELEEHPTWTLAHLAAKFCLYDSFSDPRIDSCINSYDTVDGVSPLQVAIRNEHFRTVEALLGKSSSLEHYDNELNSVFHDAATTTKEIINLLAKNASPYLLSTVNANGLTPLHMACMADKLDCVKALIVAGADINKIALRNGNVDVEPSYLGKYFEDNHISSFSVKDIKLGGTPLHWSCSGPVINALLMQNCYIDAVNFKQQTALHMMVVRERLECVVALLSNGANTELGDDIGKRPIHYAVEKGNLSILQALIVFNADINVLNNKAESPRHLMTSAQEPKLLHILHAVGADRCPQGMENCTAGCNYNETYNGVMPPPPIAGTNRDILDEMLSVAASKKKCDSSKKKRGRLLCLDGGGIRGLILIQILLELERAAEMPINFCFDWVSGTSTGGILALAIGAGKTMKECQNLYFRLKDTAFAGSRPHDSVKLEENLQNTFGVNTTMSSFVKPRVMVTGVLADRKPVELHLFRNYKSAADLLNVPQHYLFDHLLPPEKQLIWQVGRATGAAPTYFKPFERFIDGGLIANNPTLDALTEIQEHCLALEAVNRTEEAIPVSLVVSLGTGLIPVKKIRDTDCYNPTKLIDGLKILSGVSLLLQLLIDQSTQSDGRVVDRARAWCTSIGVPFFRFSPQLSEDVGLDETSNEKLCNMLWETKVYMYDKRNTLIELVDLLKND